MAGRGRGGGGSGMRVGGGVPAAAASFGNAIPMSSGTMLQPSTNVARITLEEFKMRHSALTPNERKKDIMEHIQGTVVKKRTINGRLHFVDIHSETVEKFQLMCDARFVVASLFLSFSISVGV